jgi:hypothetical protein
MLKSDTPLPVYGVLHLCTATPLFAFNDGQTAATGWQEGTGHSGWTQKNERKSEEINDINNPTMI